MKIKIVSFLLFFIVLNAFSQDTKMKFGLRAGLMSVNQKLSGYKSISPSLISYNFGVFAETHKINDNMVIQPSLLFTIKGNGKNNQTSGLQYEKATYSYLELPINFLFNISEKIKVGGGPYAAYFLNGKIGSESFKISSTSSLKKIDLGYNAIFQIDVSSGFGVAVNYGSSFPIKNSSMNKVIGLSLLKSV
jgi:Outer membrane protein beta-barrel domain